MTSISRAPTAWPSRARCSWRAAACLRPGPAATASRSASSGSEPALNILALLDLWRAHRPAGGRLHIFTVDAWPLTAAEAARALGAWPQLAGLAEPLLARWPGRAAGLPPRGPSGPARRARPGGDGRRGRPGGVGRTGGRLVPRRLLPRQEPPDVERSGAGPGRGALGARGPGGDLHRGRRRAARTAGRRLHRLQAAGVWPQGRAAGGDAAGPGAAPRAAGDRRHRRGGNRRRGPGAGVPGAGRRADGVRRARRRGRRLGQSGGPGHAAAGRRRRPGGPAPRPRRSPAPSPSTAARRRTPSSPAEPCSSKPARATPAVSSRCSPAISSKRAPWSR